VNKHLDHPQNCKYETFGPKLHEMKISPWT